MLREAMGRGATIDAAINDAAKALGVDVADCSIEIVETPKRSLFGKNRDAVVKAVTELESEQTQASKILEQEIKEDKKTDSKPNPAAKAPRSGSSAEGRRSEKKPRVKSSAENVLAKIEVAKAYLRGILDSMGLNEVELVVEEDEEGAKITFTGEKIAVLIGHHGETLDALQYLVTLTCNRVDNDYCRITLDCGDYRDKREETLKSLAARIAAKVKKTGRSQTLEPMNPYERRIIHAVVSDIDGVFSKSNGEEPNRRVVILSETPSSGGYNKNRRSSGGNGGKQPYKPYVHQPERTMEDILKNDFKEKEESAELYSKIEF